MEARGSGSGFEATFAARVRAGNGPELAPVSAMAGALVVLTPALG